VNFIEGGAMSRSLPGRSRLFGAILVSSLAAAFVPGAAAQTQVKPGFNVFSVQQDIEIGRQSAAEAERQLRLVRDRSVDEYLNEIVEELAEGSTGPKFPYHAQAVNAAEINAFALPGGPLYVNRGLIQAARSEGELAGVVAHEMAHIALRHATHNVSKAYMAQAGLGILGGLLGGRTGRSTAQIINSVGGFGLNALFLKYSRDAETQADIVGAQMMARAGYDPLDMATFFDLLRQQARRDPGGLEQFFSSHPAPADRAARIRKEAEALGAVGRRTASVGGFEEIQSRLRSRGPAPSMGRLARGDSRTDDRRGGYGGRPVDVRIERPSSRFRTFEAEDGVFEIDYPENWRAFEAESGMGVTLAPESGITEGGGGEQGIVYGVIVNRYDPFESPADSERPGRSYDPDLDQATDDLVEQLLRTNSYLRRSRDPRREVVDGARALVLTLSGRSPLTGQDERVTVFTRELPRGDVLYSLLIAPSRDYASLEDTFDRMLASLRVDDDEEAVRR
jgi:Zn-dependent protease with chaperone function